MTRVKTPPLRINRRNFLRWAGGISAAAVIRPPGLFAAEPDAPRMTLLEIRVISRDPRHYHGWPTLARRRNGELLLAYSGGREGHVCPFGRVELMVSRNDGRDWGWPQVLFDSPIDDRDAGALETASGALLITTFTSLAYEAALGKAERRKPGATDAWPRQRLEAWRAAHERISAGERQASLGQWLLRSTDGGLSWSGRLPSLVNSPHGPIQLADGRLLYAGIELWSSPRRVGVCESMDDGQTWRWLAEIPARAGDQTGSYHELHCVETADGRVVAHLRNHNPVNPGETLQSESADGGQTWSEPRAIGVWGLPSFLSRLRDGRLLMTYGYRRAPFGNQARISEDHGRTWSRPVTISADGASVDLGYPSTVELADGTLLTVWYEKLEASPQAVLRQARWRLIG